MENENMTNWLTEENKRIQESRPNIEEKESLRFVENDIIEFTVDFEAPFDKWVDPNDEKLIKKIIPVVQGGIRKNLWLNTKNPLYAEIIKKGVEGINTFKVLQVGSGKDTKYILK